MATLSSLVGGGSGGGFTDGARNATEMWNSYGSYTWTVPSNFDNSVALKIYCWGAGGNSGIDDSQGNSYGGGGGGLAIKEITSLSAGDTVAVTIGEASNGDHNSRGGVTSFGGHCSANAGNDGQNPANPSGNPMSTGENSNPQASINSGYGQGGVGVGGDINRRGGQGGVGGNSPGSGGGGGGGSAPHPQGHKDGYRGGNYDSYSGGSGASINFPGSRPNASYTGTGGAGTASQGSSNRWGATTYRSNAGQGGAGLNGAGGRGATANTYSNAWTFCCPATDGHGTAIWGANHIFLGGGGGGGGCCTKQSSERAGSNGGCGGPGAGGGGCHSYESSNDVAWWVGGTGGVLGGGGGGGQYCTGGSGGNAGGAGSNGYDGRVGYNQASNNYNNWWGSQRGGDGLIFIQYKVT